MCFINSSRSPAAPPPPSAPPPPPAPAVESESPEAQQARSGARRRAALAKGRGSTVLTSGLGLTDDQDQQGKSLLGQ